MTTNLQNLLGPNLRNYMYNWIIINIKPHDKPASAICPATWKWLRHLKHKVVHWRKKSPPLQEILRCNIPVDSAVEASDSRSRASPIRMTWSVCPPPFVAHKAGQPECTSLLQPIPMLMSVQLVVMDPGAVSAFFHSTRSMPAVPENTSNT